MISIVSALVNTQQMVIIISVFSLKKKDVISYTSIKMFKKNMVTTCHRHLERETVAY